MSYGLTDTGFNGKTAEVVKQDFEDGLRGSQGVGPDLLFLAEDFFGGLSNITADEASQVWEALADLAAAFDPDAATGALAENQAALFGVPRNGAEYGYVTVSLGLADGFAKAAGEMIAFVEGQPTNRWVNRDAIPSRPAGTYTAVFRSETKGAWFAAATKLNQRATLHVGWASVNNPLDANPGQEIEPIEALKVRRSQAVASGGFGTAAAIRAAVVKVAGVEECKPLRNNTLQVDATGLASRSVEFLIWDGLTPAALDVDIATAIASKSCPGRSHAGVTRVTVVDADGDSEVWAFTRATAKQFYLTATILAPTGVDEADLKVRFAKAGTALIGNAVSYARLSGVPFYEGSPVKGITNLKIGFSPAPTGVVDLPIDAREKAILLTTNVSLTVVAS